MVRFHKVSCNRIIFMREKKNKNEKIGVLRFSLKL